MKVVRVLVVDDQAPYRRAMANVVEETDGFELVGSACSGREALLVAATLAPDLVLMDVDMDDMDGVHATRLLLAGAQAPVVLLLSIYDEEAGAALVADCGAAAYVPKPAFGPDRLEAAWAAADR